jgi:hypothetical protein
MLKIHIRDFSLTVSVVYPRMKNTNIGGWKSGRDVICIRLFAIHPIKRRKPMANERRKLEELNLLDNFLFGTMVTHPDYGEPFARYLLRLVLNREVGKLKVIPQSVYFASDTELHGAILDAYLVEGDEGSDAMVYDVEPENDSHSEAVKALPRRMRFYRAKMDGRGLKAGEDYGKLQNLVMIMITPFDPFGLGA